MASRSLTSPSWTRRSFLGVGAAAAAAALMPARAAAATREAAGRPERVLSFFNTHTGERLTTAYCCGGAYQPEALQQINAPAARLPGQRDQADRSRPAGSPARAARHARHRSAVPRDLGLPLAADQRDAAGARRRRFRRRVAAACTWSARRSTFACPAWSSNNLRDSARSLKLGGVGFYPSSNFVHVDTGRVRFW